MSPERGNYGAFPPPFSSSLFSAALKYKLRALESPAHFRPDHPPRRGVRPHPYGPSRHVRTVLHCLALVPLTLASPQAQRFFPSRWGRLPEKFFSLPSRPPLTEPDESGLLSQLPSHVDSVLTEPQGRKLASFLYMTLPLEGPL